MSTNTVCVSTDRSKVVVLGVVRLLYVFFGALPQSIVSSYMVWKLRVNVSFVLSTYSMNCGQLPMRIRS